jgi:RNA polymerase sigma-70 factor (ECF subfamily)
MIGPCCTVLLAGFALAVLAQLSDAQLVEHFRAGDQHAFSHIVRRYQDRVFSLCLRWIGDAAVAEEVAQDVFVAVYRSLGGFRGESSLSTWIFRVAVNHCKNKRLYRSRRKVDRHEPLDGPARDDTPPRQLPAPGQGAEAGLMATEAEVLVTEALDSLSEEHRQVIVLRDIQDLDYHEISEILDLPRGTVKSRLHRARSELARALRNRIGQEDVKPRHG